MARDALTCRPRSTPAAVNGPIAADVASLAAVLRGSSASPIRSPASRTPPHLPVQDSPRRNKVLDIPDQRITQADPGVRKLYDAMMDKLMAPQYGYRKVLVRIPFLSEGTTSRPIPAGAIRFFCFQRSLSLPTDKQHLNWHRHIRINHGQLRLQPAADPDCGRYDRKAATGHGILQNRAASTAPTTRSRRSAAWRNAGFGNL